MAFRISIQGAVVEADTAQDVQALLLAMAEPLPRALLAPPASTVQADEAPPVSRRRAVPRNAKPARQARPVRSAAPKKATRVAGDVVVERVLEAIRSGISVPAAIREHAAAPVFAVRVALRQLLERRQVRAEGATMSRRYYLAGSRAGSSARPPAPPAKEAVR